MDPFVVAKKQLAESASTKAPMLRRFLEINRSISLRIGGSLPQARDRIFSRYLAVVVERMTVPGVRLVADVGGGRSCPFARFRQRGSGIQIAAVDVTAEAMQGNSDVDDKRVADVVQDGLPFGAEEVDLIVSRSVLEHLRDVDRFVTNCRAVLAPGGRCVHVFSCRRSPFAVLNRLLPERLAAGLLFFLRPAAKDICGYAAYYDRCYHSAMTKVFERNGFEVEETFVAYHSSGYYAFFVPLFLLSALYEMIVRALGLKDLGSHMLIVARRSP